MEPFFRILEGTKIFLLSRTEHFYLKYFPLLIKCCKNKASSMNVFSPVFKWFNSKWPPKVGIHLSFLALGKPVLIFNISKVDLFIIKKFF
jgi:hypothetical protein